MSLVVWLPMTKDLRQQGLSSVTVTNNGATFNSSGKLGDCYSFGTGDSYITIDPTPLKTFTEFSFACWVKIISWNTSYSTIFAAKNGTGVSWNNLIFSLLRNSSNSTLCFNISNGSNYTKTNCQTGTLSLDTWYHITCTYKSGEIKLYQDGDVVSTYKTTVIPNFNSIANLWIGKSNASSYQSNNLMNDVRIYDHCLSPMEVKRISQGLVLHYPLNRMGFGQDNLMVNTHFDLRYTQSTGWNTTKNGTLLANSWGGYNSGVTNASSVYHAHLKEIGGEYVYEYIKTSNESWLGISQWSFESKLTAGETYTFSWEEYHVEGTNRVGTGLYYYKTGATSANFHLGIQQASNVTRVLGQWQKFSYTFVAPTDADWSKSMGWYIYGHYNGNGTFYMRHPKLEKGSIPTPWSPAPSDALANAIGLNSNIEYDISGYYNNATKNKTFTYISDTPKYSVSAKFDGTNSATTSSIFDSTTRHSELTIATWIKRTSDDANYHYYLSSSGVSVGIRSYNSVNNYYLISWNHATDSSSSVNSWVNTVMPLNTWVHSIWTFSHGVMKHYINGELKGTSDRSATGTYILGDICSIIGTGYSASSNWEGGLSDFRIYATALSATDVKSLYQNTATIDADGTIHGAVR